MSLVMNLSSPQHSSDMSSNPSGEYVMVSKLDQEALVVRDKAPMNRSCNEEDLIQRVSVLTKENEELKGILKHNNVLVQQYFQDLTSMQQNQKEAQESLKKEHSRAKEVVTKLREKNKSLQSELQQAKDMINAMEKGMSSDNMALKMTSEKLQTENRLLQSHINTLQAQISCFDKQFKGAEKLEVASESWTHFLDSVERLDLTTSKTNERGELRDSLLLIMEEKYSTLEREKEILDVDLEKLRIEKQTADEQLQLLTEEHEKLLAELKAEKEQVKRGIDEEQEKVFQGVFEEQNKLQNSVTHLREEKQELCRLLTECKDKENKHMEDKNLFEGTIKKLEEMVAKLQREKREQQETVIHGVVLKQQENEELRRELDAEKARTAQLVCDREELQNMKEAKKESEAIFGAPEDDSMIKLKEEARKEDWLQYQKRRNEYEWKLEILLGREEVIKAKEKQIEEQRGRIEQQLAETREMMQAELESKAQSYNDQTHHLHSELEEGRAREESLREQVEQLMQENRSLEAKCNQLEIVNSEREEAFKERVNTIAGRSEIQKQQVDEQTQQLRSQLAIIEDDLKRSRGQFMMLKEEHDTLLTQHGQVMGEYEDLMRAYQSTIDTNTKKQRGTSTEMSSMKAQMEQLNAQIVAAEEAILKRDNQLRFLEEQANSVPVLQQQIEVYRKDFAAEREAREIQHDELLRRQNANQLLQDELDNLYQGQMAEMQRRHGSHDPSGGTWPRHFRRGGEPGDPEEVGVGDRRRPPAGGTEEPFVCPGCRVIVENFSAYEAHVAGCAPARHGNGPPLPGPSHSQANQCPSCGDVFPDFDTLNIHVNECLDRT